MLLSPEAKELLGRFESLWPQQRPSLEDFLNACPPRERLAMLIELVHSDLEFRLRAGEPARVEDYLERYPELAGRPEVVASLRATEGRLRRRFQAGWEAADLLRALNEYHLVEPVQAEHIAGLRTHFPDARALAGELIRRGWLTPYQVNQLFAGRGDSLLLGSYVVVERLGEGGMGQVFKARSRNLGRVVALKVVHQNAKAQPSLIQRFVREIQAIARLNHPNIVHAYDAELAGGLYFLVMEFVEGTDLEHLVRHHGPLPVSTACDCARQAALGLQHAHGQGLIHRDVKPSNLLLAKDGTVKLLDLGLARFRLAVEEEEGRTATSGLLAASGLTQEGAVMGTPDFMAPEQAEESHAVDARADLYSLGCTLYFLLTGQPPFPGGTLMQKFRRHEREEPPPVGQRRPGVPAELDAVLRRLMAKRPADRYPDAGAAAAALAALARSDSPPPPALPAADRAAVATPLPSSPTAEAFAVAAESPRPAGWRERRRQRYRLLVAAAVLLASAGSVAWWIRRDSADKPPDPEVAKQPLSPEEELEALRRRLNAPTREKREALAQEVRAFRSRQAGTRLAPAAAPLLRRLPSPLDRLPPVPASERFAWQPDNLVAVLGEHRQRHWGLALCVAFHPQGRLLASGGGDARLRIWDADTGRELAVLEGHTSWVRGVAFRPDGKTLASGSSDTTVRLWSITAEPLKIEERAVLKGHTSEVSGVAFRPDGQTLASCSHDGTVRLWEMTDAGAEERAVLRGHERKVLAVAFSPDGMTLASVGVDGMIRLWDPGAGKERQTLRVQPSEMPCLAFSPDGKTLLSGGYGNIVKRWDLVSGKETAPLPSLPSAWTRCVAFSPDGSTFATGGYRGGVHVWDAARAAVRTVLDSEPSELTDYYGLAFDAAGRRLAVASSQSIVRVYDTGTWKESHPVEGPAGPIQALSLAPDDRTLAVAGHDGLVRLWDFPTARVRGQWPVPGPSYFFPCLAFRPPDGATLATATPHLVQLCDPATGQVRETLDDGKEATRRQGPQGLAWSADGKVLAAGYNSGQVSLWEPGSGKPERSFVAHKGSVLAVAFPPSGGRALATGGIDAFVHLWRDPFTDREPETWKCPHQAHGVVFSPDGKTLTAAGYGDVLRWDVGTGEPRPTLDFQRWVYTVAYSPDGRTLAAIAESGHLLWWDSVSGKKLGEWRAPGPFPHNVLAFASDSRHLFVGNANGTVYVLRLASVPDSQE